LKAHSKRGKIAKNLKPTIYFKHGIYFGQIGSVKQPNNSEYYRAPLKRLAVLFQTN
jgi:hypothetical protein